MKHGRAVKAKFNGNSVGADVRNSSFDARYAGIVHTISDFKTYPKDHKWPRHNRYRGMRRDRIALLQYQGLPVNAQTMGSLWGRNP